MVEKKDEEKLLLPVPASLCPQLSVPPLSAGVKSRKLLLYYSKSRGSFFSPPFFLLPRVCVDDFKLYLFFMSICTFKDLLQEYLKGQEP